MIFHFFYFILYFFSPFCIPSFLSFLLIHNSHPSTFVTFTLTLCPTTLSVIDKCPTLPFVLLPHPDSLGQRIPKTHLTANLFFCFVRQYGEKTHTLLLLRIHAYTHTRIHLIAHRPSSSSSTVPACWEDRFV